MACQFCPEIPRELGSDGKWVHVLPRSERRYCEDQPQKRDDTPPMTDAERTQLYLMIEIASDIRMRHDVRLYDSLDWTRELFAEGFQGTKEKAIEVLLLRHHHVCTPACLAPKVIE